MSPRSFKRYRLVPLLARSWLRCVSMYAVQTESYASCYRALGVQPERIRVTGSVKYDGVIGDRANARTQDLKRLLGVGSNELIWVAGSTQSPEETIVLDIYRFLYRNYPSLRLIIVPRQKDRFEEVAAFLSRSGLPFVRRTQLTMPLQNREAIVLMDTIGELGALWGIADIAFVGGSLDGRRGGQNMIEPAAYGAAVVFGPHVWNFRDTVNRLLEAEAAVQIHDATELEKAMDRLIREPAERQRLGKAARQLVLSQQGATERTLDCLDELFTQVPSHHQAA
jgi:3-deoxy-D-manno-octulosonic-acid transferase